MSRRIPLQISLLAMAGLALASCGKMGSLERPGPMFGHAGVAADHQGDQQDPNRPVKTIDPRDPDPDTRQTSTPR